MGLALIWENDYIAAAITSLSDFSETGESPQRLFAMGIVNDPIPDDQHSVQSFRQRSQLSFHRGPTLNRIRLPLSCIAILMIAAGMVCLQGCGYIVGSPYGPEVRSVDVPTFTNKTFRRGFELQLTEAVHKKIELNTPFRLSKGPQADTRLMGSIVSINKRPENQNRYDDPRELELAIGIEVTWIDNRTGAVLAKRTRPVGPQLSHAIAHASFAPETGQSMATATQDAVDQLAGEIVGMMEAPW